MAEREDLYRILIVEDGSVNQRVLVETLQGGYQLSVAATGEQALKMAIDFRPHLILLDIILPDANGFNVLKELKELEQTRTIPVIIITGLDNDADEERGLHLGAVDYIRKPFSKTIVQARVRIHIQIVRQIMTIEKLSFLDALTELANRRKFDYQIEYEWHRAIRKKTSIGLLMIDLDNFKIYNDTYGHAQGDVLLQAVGRVLKNTLKRTTDIPCRWGGEEFAVLLPETGPDEVAGIAERLRAEIEQLRLPCGNEETRITASVGAALTAPQKNEKFSDFMQQTDDLLYKAKKNGRNRVER